MAKSSIEAYGAESEFKGLLFAPEKLVIISDKKHPLYVDKAERPITDAFIKNIVHNGVIQAVTITKDDEYGVVVVAGRRRTRGLIAANKILVARGEEPHKLRCIARKGTPLELFSALVSENEHREPETPFGRARQMQRMLDLGCSIEDLGARFDLSKGAVTNTLALLEATPEAREAGEANLIPATAISAMVKSGMSEKEQKTAVRKIIKETGGSKSKRKRSATLKGLTQGKKPPVRARKTIAAKIAELIKGGADPFHMGAIAFAKWVLGDDAALKEIVG